LLDRQQPAGSGQRGSLRIGPDGDLHVKISRQTLRQLDGIELVRIKRDQGQQNLGFSSRPFVLCGLPLRRPRAGQLLFERRNGHFVLQVTGHPEYGLPFGQDRIVPIFLATLAVRQQSQTIRFSTAAEMLETFGMQKGGKQYRRLVSAFERVFGATIFFRTDNRLGSAKVIHSARFNFFREAQIWYHRSTRPVPLFERSENVIVLSDDFYRELVSHPIPMDLDAVRVLHAAPGILDFFVWLSYRCFTARGEERIPLFGAFGLANQLGSVEYSRPRRFRTKLDEWLEVISAIWPECPARISVDGQDLRIQPATALRHSQ
jgi:hypothetical protein